VAKLIHPTSSRSTTPASMRVATTSLWSTCRGAPGADPTAHGPLDGETTAEIGAQGLRRTRLRPPARDHPPRRQAGQPDDRRRPGRRRRDDDEADDFGIARAVEQTRITQVGSVVGMPPTSRPSSGAARRQHPPPDVYALGVVLYQFLTGRLPMRARPWPSWRCASRTRSRCRPAPTTTRCRRHSAAAVLRALEGDPNRRYASAGELAGAWRSACRART